MFMKCYGGVACCGCLKRVTKTAGLCAPLAYVGVALLHELKLLPSHRLDIDAWDGQGGWAVERRLGEGASCSLQASGGHTASGGPLGGHLQGTASAACRCPSFRFLDCVLGVLWSSGPFDVAQRLRGAY